MILYKPDLCVGLENLIKEKCQFEYCQRHSELKELSKTLFLFGLYSSIKHSKHISYSLKN